MKKEPGLTTGISETETVDTFLKKLEHPMHDTITYLREFILSIDKKIGEGIFWNAPVFFYTGKLKPFNRKEYRRYIVGLNFYRTDAVRLIFLRGADASDPKKILEGNYKDGRRLVSLKGTDDLKSKEPELKKIVKQLVQRMDN